MNLNISYKKIICFLLAVLMLLSTVGCAQETKKKKKKKVIVTTEQVIVKNDKDDDDDKNNNNTVIVDKDDNNDTISDKKTLPKRPLPEEKVTTVVEKYQEVFEPEFEYDYADWAGPEGYTVVYSHSEPNNRIPAANLVTFIKDNYNVNLGLPVKDNSAEAQAATKKILIGDTAFKTSTLKDTEYAVTVCDNGDLFFEGGHYAMVETAEEWFETVDIKSGKVATLYGTNEEFKSTVTLNGKTYNYVWGDEFDGDALVDNEKWSQGPFSVVADIATVHGDRHFHAVENGRLRMTADIYYDETDGNVNYAISGTTRTSNTMSFRNGYVEVRVRMPYAQGAFPAIWTMSSDNGLEKQLPNYEEDDGYGVYKKRIWDLEFDLFESFSDLDKWTTTIHKWYTNIESYDSKTGVAQVLFDFQDGNGPINVTDKLLFKGWNSSSSSVTKAYFWAYRNDPSTEWCSTNSGESYEYIFTEEEQKTINNEYHIYSYHYTGDHCTVYFDGEVFLDWDWDPNFDYVDHVDLSKNNNGVGYNLWHYMIFDMMLYTPIRTDKDVEDLCGPEDMPYSLYIDYLRIYQDPTDPSQAIYFPNGQE